VEHRQLDPAVAVRGPHDGDVRSDAVQPDELVHPFTLDCCLALQLHTEFDEERNSSRKVVDNDEDVVHPFDHSGSPSSSHGRSWPLVSSGMQQRYIHDTRRRAEFQDLLAACRLAVVAAGAGPSPGDVGAVDVQADGGAGAGVANPVDVTRRGETADCAPPPPCAATTPASNCTWPTPTRRWH
jgi:hypothetical protein